MADYVAFDEVRKTYRMGDYDIEALAGVSFGIEEGQFVIIAGASGAGKSTILNILGGMDVPTSGKTFFNGAEVSSYSQKQMVEYRRYDVGFVFQFYNLIPNLTARENVELASQVSRDPLDIDDVMASVGLGERMPNFPSQLSGGEQQRVAIARAVAKNPKLLLCDEPTGALDYETGRQILKLLQETCQNRGITVVVITHNPALMPMGDRVIKVRSGRIDEIVDNPVPVGINSLEW
ncbi:MAG: macrolide ABC transporter ATP-binding protein [Actinobacteria bacterium HGW-Actinobacteria-5]|nr:MAG: macrolide ABC transporter ATP-binding protein [Actinobacteria bacterium HGW-Actinobacteria-5]